jgi:ADP-heptose:LPS heptosyltransferase
MKHKVRILLVHLVSLGDCLFVTALARQIKQDYPDCHLTWAISNRCSQIIQNNPYVDEIWEIFSENMSENYGSAWEQTKKEAILKKEKKLYDYLFFTQIFPDNISNYDGTTRSSTFRNYPNPITVPISPIIVLNEKEIENVQTFARKHKLQEFRRVILFECSPQSGQSPVNTDFALELSKKIVDKFEDCVVLLTSNQKIITGHPHIIDASGITFRENAELSKYCDLLIGCSSGITWLLTSTWAKKIPTIQILNKKSSEFTFASVSYDLKYWGESIHHIIEITKPEHQYILNCIEMTLEEGVEKARNKYNEELKPNVASLEEIIRILIFKKEWEKIIKVSKNFYDRNKNPFVIAVVPYAIVKTLIIILLSIIKRKQ